VPADAAATPLFIAILLCKAICFLFHCSPRFSSSSKSGLLSCFENTEIPQPKTKGSDHNRIKSESGILLFCISHSYLFLKGGPNNRMITPDRVRLSHWRGAQSDSVYREILADRLPRSPHEKLTVPGRAGRKWLCLLLESVERATCLGRYSFLGRNPSLVFRKQRQHANHHR